MPYMISEGKYNHAIWKFILFKMNYLKFVGLEGY